MSSLLSFILIVFWLSVLGMVFGNYIISQISAYVFYLAAPLALIVGILEIINKNNHHSG
ncbi:MAG: hypothetical protein GX248_09335 [Peptococcaceae bacterium]|jgi:hypothetical protein|nr:hypothetical protein [Peptococcaceae bacterium]